MINKTRIYSIFIFFLWILFHSTYCAYAEKTAIVIKSQNLSAYNKVIKGFEAECIQKDITIKSIYDLKGKMKIGHKTVRKIRKEKPDIILTIGVLATTIAKEEIKDIPIVFCMVINHARFQLTGANITGIAAEISVEEQLKGYQTILNPLKNIGVIYDPSKTGNMIENAEKKAKDISMNLVKYEINSSKEVPEAMEGLTGRIDALWLLPDSTVVTKKSFSLIKTTTLENKIPLLCTSAVFVKAGALAAVSSDHRDVGRQAAELARKILELSTPGSLGIVYPDRFKLTVNTDTAKQLGLELEVVQEGPMINFYP
jgi:putative ABC transport system substrate-binding protein